MFQKCPIAEKTKHSALKTLWRKLFPICQKRPKARFKKPEEAVFSDNEAFCYTSRKSSFKNYEGPDL